MRVLLVEDEAEIRKQLVGFLRSNGYVIEAASDGEEGLYFGKEYAFDCAIIDLGLPGIGGLDVIRQLREAGKSFPVLILTARGRWEEKVEGLEAGADDYLVKPFQLEELTARIRALIRRSFGWTQPVINCGPVSINTSEQKVEVNGNPIELTAYEYSLLEYLIFQQGGVVSKAVLTEHLYAQDFERDSNVIEVFVGRLRRKLDPGNKYKPIETLRGRGYRFTLKCESR